MSTRTTLLAGLSALIAFGASARTQEITAWRGETVAALVEDFVELGEAPVGVSMRFGVLKSVKYAPVPNSVQRLTCYDRVVWGGKGAGPRVVEVTVPATAKPGDYDCGLLKVRVLDRVLPPASEWKFYLDLWQHPWASARMAKAEPFSAAHFAAMRPVWELLASAGQKVLTVSLIPEPWNHQCHDAYGTMIGRVKKADGTWKFDYSIFDRYVSFGRSCGIGPDIGCYTMCPWGYIVRWQNEKGETESAEAKPGTKEFEDFWGDFLVDFAAHLKTKGWFRDTLIAMDERTPEDVKLIADFIQKKAPGMRISMAGNRKPSDFTGITIDVYSQVLWAKCLTPEFLAEAAERRQKGYVTTHYVCCSPTYPNTFMSSGDGEAFWLAPYSTLAGLDGFLRWAWNSWPAAPCKDATYWNWRAGDTFLCYPKGQPSWRFLELRNGIAASEKIRILREAGEKKAELDALAKLYDVRKANDNACDFRAIRKKTLEIVNR